MLPKLWFMLVPPAARAVQKPASVVVNLDCAPSMSVADVVPPGAMIAVSEILSVSNISITASDATALLLAAMVTKSCS